MIWRCFRRSYYQGTRKIWGITEGVPKYHINHFFQELCDTLWTKALLKKKNNLTVASFCVKYVCHVSFRRTLKGTCTILILCSHCRVLVASILVLINTFWECLRWIIELHDTVINADFAFRDRWHYQIGWIFGKITKVWNFSENSFDLVAPSVPYHLDNSLVSQNGQFGPDRTVLLLRVIRMVRVIRVI